MIVGEPAQFAIESHIEKASPSLGQRALGFFMLHVAGCRYGVTEPDASRLACSFDTVRERIAHRGRHVTPLAAVADVQRIADQCCKARYWDAEGDDDFHGMDREELNDHLRDFKLVWAPEGEAAFDDGGHVLHFDLGDKVRLIAFNTTGDFDAPPNKVREVTIAADAFYAILDAWQQRFDAAWREALGTASCPETKQTPYN